LAVSQQAQGNGLGSILLADACRRVAVASETLAVTAIVVDAKAPKAAAFYQHIGFIELPGQPGRWMLARSHFAGLT
jgi:GNAT superfamily N-acetyltransferase